ncbi:MAG: DNA/RNA non-specific endonuclease [Spirochaetes bacterium]|nr:DNA/RNA non-specific endonuclease [Spirochaetota bacterium]
MARSLALLVCFGQAYLTAAVLKPINLRPDFDHDRWNTQPKEIVRAFEAYVSSFDGPDDDDGDGAPDLLGVPQWVSYEIKALTNTCPDGVLPKFKRPPRWMTDGDLFARGWAPDDESYHYAKAFRDRFPDSAQILYDRGHLCMKLAASRLGEAADWNTHTFLNACPQRKEMNEGIWLDLEMKTLEWADRFGRIWVICGPLFDWKKVRRFLGESNEFKVAIPDSFFKVVIREGAPPTGPLQEIPPIVLAFIYPQEIQRQKGGYRHEPYLTSIGDVEARSGLRFFGHCGPRDHLAIASGKATSLW